MSEEKKTVELKDEELEKVSGGTKIPPFDPSILVIAQKPACSMKFNCPYTSKSECTQHSDNIGCKYDN